MHGKRAPLVFWSDVPFLAPECGDHKIIWELNRHQHLLVLGRAFWLTFPVARQRSRKIAAFRDWLCDEAARACAAAAPYISAAGTPGT